MSLVRSYINASRECGRPVISLLAEALRLRQSTNQLGFSEYIDFCLYKDDLTFAQKAEFGGWRVQGILEEMLIDDQSRFLSTDKITMYTLFRGYGMPIPRLRAVYRSQRPESIHCLQTPADLADYLRAPGNLPVYMKPSFGAYGRGNTLITGIEGNDLILGDRSKVNIDTFCASIDDGGSLGWVLQDPLTPHGQIAELCGNKISGVRMHTFLTPDGPKIFKAVFKINSGLRDSDNFHHGSSGNMAAEIDLDSGKLVRVVNKPGIGQQFLQTHPTTGKQLVGFQIPYWQEIRKLVTEGHLAFPGYICPGWDIAICDNGPQVLEINAFGDLDLPQNAHHRGFLDERFMALLKTRGLDKVFFGAAGPNKRSPRNGRLGLRNHHWQW